MTATGYDADETAVRRLMAESDLDVDGEDALLAALLELRSLRHDAIVVPSAGVAALMTGPRRRRLRTRGAIVVALVAAASVSTGLSAAAAPQLGAGARQAIAAVIHAVSPIAAPPAHHAPAHHAPASSPPRAVPARATGTAASTHPLRRAPGPSAATTTVTDASGPEPARQHEASDAVGHRGSQARSSDSSPRSAPDPVPGVSSEGSGDRGVPDRSPGSGQGSGQGSGESDRSTADGAGDATGQGGSSSSDPAAD